MINYNIILQVVCEMWNIEMLLKTMKQLQTAAEFASNLTAKISLLLAI